MPYVFRAITLAVLTAVGGFIVGAKGGAGGDLVIRTECDSYSPCDTVAVVFENGRAESVFVHNQGCLAMDRKPLPSLMHERREPEGWQPHNAGYVCGAIAVAPTEIEPGGRYVVRFLGGVVNPLPPGEYRFVVNVRPGPYVAGVLPEAERTSTAFRVE